jgi:formylglycine-generating enzyme required for sulfatase activity
VKAIARSVRLSVWLPLLLASAATAQGAKPLSKCAPDAVVSGDVCLDRFEAAVYRIDPVEGANLIKKVQQGKVTTKDLEAGDAELLGSADDYAPCTDTGDECGDIFAISLAGQVPASNVTWFQAQQACKNSRKRLPTNAEWQAAVVGTPDGADNSPTTCNTVTATTKLPAGQRTGCVSSDGAFDMVGNVREWVDDWVPLSTGCGHWPSSISANDAQCLAGASAGANDEPGALWRGGGYTDDTSAGPFAIDGRNGPSSSGPETGFRCVR